MRRLSARLPGQALRLGVDQDSLALVCTGGLFGARRELVAERRPSTWRAGRAGAGLRTLLGEAGWRAGPSPWCWPTNWRAFGRWRRRRRCRSRRPRGRGRDAFCEPVRGPPGAEGASPPSIRPPLPRRRLPSKSWLAAPRSGAHLRSCCALHLVEVVAPFRARHERLRNSADSSARLVSALSPSCAWPGRL